MTYSNKYPNYTNCPVYKHCDTIVSPMNLCHSCDKPSIEEIDAYAEEQIAMSLEIM